MSRNHAKIGKGLSLTPVAARPSDPENGDLIYNNANAQFEKYENGAWSMLSSAAAPYLVFARNSSGQVLTTGVQTTVTNWTETTDTDNDFNATTGVWTCSTAGKYMFVAMMTIGDTVSLGDRVFFIRDVTNSADISMCLRPFSTGASSQVTQTVVGCVDAAIGRQISIQALQGAGANQSITPVASRNTLTIIKV